MDEDVAIKVNDLHKSFTLAENRHTSVKQLLLNLGRRHAKHRQTVLDGINFEVKKGEFFGIVGRNGSGKSTLLKILAGVYVPDSGAVQLNGNLTPFIELGVGFNPELSGRDNVYLSASLLGYPRKVVDKMYDEIVDFAELHDHMDKKLKNYSSGMQVRLAFSIAIKAKNDILIFDEVLAVGDEAFQQKCLRIFEEYRVNKQTVVLVTHDMSTVRNLCTRAMLIDDGKIKHIGPVDSVAQQYSDMLARKEDVQEEALKDASAAQTSSQLVIKPPVKKVYMPSEELSLHVAWKGDFDPNQHIIGVAIIRSDGEYVFGSNTRDMKLKRASVTFTTKLDLGPGRYTVTAAVLDKLGGAIDINDKALAFRVIDDGRTDVGGSSRLTYEYEEDKTN
jgi:ABC-2 type transport system ATP-binding protein